MTSRTQKAPAAASTDAAATECAYLEQFCRTHADVRTFREGVPLADADSYTSLFTALIKHRLDAK